MLLKKLLLLLLLLLLFICLSHCYGIVWILIYFLINSPFNVCDLQDPYELCGSQSL